MLFIVKNCFLVNNVHMLLSIRSLSDYIATAGGDDTLRIFREVHQLDLRLERREKVISCFPPRLQVLQEVKPTLILYGRSPR